MTEQTKHIAARVDAGLEDRDFRYFPANPHSTDPIDWSCAFLASGDVSTQAIHMWFNNAMLTARYGFYHPDPAMDDD